MLASALVASLWRTPQATTDHFVDMVIPLGGFGNRLDTMYEFHDRHGIEAKRGQDGATKKRAAIILGGASRIRL